MADARGIASALALAGLCPGCGDPPVDVGSFGRVKLCCRNYAAHDREKTTERCIGTADTCSWHDPARARSEWDRQAAAGGPDRHR